MPLRPVSLAAVIRLCVYGMLVLSAAMTWLSGNLWRAWRAGELSTWKALAPQLTFAAFVAVYTIDRILLVRRGATSANRALWQVGFALLFLTLLLPVQLSERRVQHHLDSRLPHAALLLLGHADVQVRQAACILVANHPSPGIYEQVSHMALHDPDPGVRDHCTAALERMHAAAAAAKSAASGH